MTGADTAVAVGSGEAPALDTPCLLALAEQTTVAAAAGALAVPQASTLQRIPYCFP